MIDSKKARPDVAVRVAGSVVAVQVEKAVVLVAVVVTTAVQDYAPRGIVAEYRKKGHRTTGRVAPIVVYVSYEGVATPSCSPLGEFKEARPDAAARDAGPAVAAQAEKAAALVAVIAATAAQNHATGGIVAVVTNITFASSSHRCRINKPVEGFFCLLPGGNIAA